MDHPRRPLAILVACLAVAASLSAGAHAAATAEEVAVGDFPLSLAIDPARELAFVTNLGDDTVTIVDLVTWSRAGEIALPGGGVGVAVDGDLLHVSHAQPEGVTTFDIDSRTSVGTGQAGPAPGALAIDPAGRLWAVNRGAGTVVVVGPDGTHTVVVGGEPMAVAFDAGRSRAYVAAQTGERVAVLDLDSLTEIASVGTAGAASSLAVAPDGTVFAGQSCCDGGSVAVIAPDPPVLSSRIPMPNSVVDVAIDPARGRLYAAMFSFAHVAAFDLAALARLADLPLPGPANNVNVLDGRIHATIESRGTLVRFVDDLPPPRLPGAPTGLTASTPAPGQVALRWQPPSDDGGTAVHAYHLYRSQASGAEQHVASPAGPDHTDTELPPRTTYTYRVRAVNGLGEGPPSEPLTVTTLAIPSGECASEPVADGYLGDDYVRLAVDQRPDGEVWICLRARTGGAPVVEHGARYVVRHDGVGEVAVDEDAAACAAEPDPVAEIAPVEGRIGDAADPAGQVGYSVSQYTSLARGQLWVCASVGSEPLSAGRRVVVPVGAEVDVEFDPFGVGAPAPRPNPGTASGVCADRSLLNLALGGSHVWLATAPVGDRRTALCVRVEGSQTAGGRLDVDASGIGALLPEATRTDGAPTVCDRNVVDDESTRLHVRRSSDAEPAAVCVFLLGAWHGVSVGPQTGDPLAPSVSWTPD